MQHLLAIVVALVALQGATVEGLNCYSCEYKITPGTLGNYMTCVLFHGPTSSQPTADKGKYCVTRLIYNRFTDNVQYYIRGSSDVDFGNGVVDVNSTLVQFSATCTDPLCNNADGSPYGQRWIPTSLGIQCLECTYTPSDPSSWGCVNAPGDVATFTKGASTDFCTTSATYTINGNTVVITSFSRGLSHSNAIWGPTAINGGAMTVSLSCNSAQQCNGLIVNSMWWSGMQVVPSDNSAGNQIATTLAQTVQPVQPAAPIQCYQCSYQNDIAEPSFNCVIAPDMIPAGNIVTGQTGGYCIITAQILKIFGTASGAPVRIVTQIKRDYSPLRFENTCTDEALPFAGLTLQTCTTSSVVSYGNINNALNPFPGES